LVLRVDFDEHWHTYARMLARESKIAFYDHRTTEADVDLESVIKSPILFVVEVFNRAYDKGRWPRVGHVPLDVAPIPIPDRFMQDIGTGKCQIIDEFFNERPATPQECVGMEKVAVREAEGVEQRLRDHYAGRPNAMVDYFKVRL
jgi:hypothetical protein